MALPMREEDARVCIERFLLLLLVQVRQRYNGRVRLGLRQEQSHLMYFWSGDLVPGGGESRVISPLLKIINEFLDSTFFQAEGQNTITDDELQEVLSRVLSSGKVLELVELFLSDLSQCEPV